MKTKIWATLLVIAASFGVLGIYVVKNRTDISAQSTTIQVELRNIAYTADHLSIEYVVQGQITTPFGPLAECPVGGSTVINNAGDAISGGSDDFIDCRPDGNGGYLVTQFFYSDFGINSKRPRNVNITIGDVDFTTAGGKVVHVNPVGNYSFAVPTQPDLDSVTYPTDVAQAASGLKMNVNRVDFSPSLAKVDACLTLPDSGDWVFDAYLVYKGQKIPFEYWAVKDYKTPGVLDSSQRCYSVVVPGVPDYRTIKKGELSFLIEKISRNMPECVNAIDYSKIKDELNKYGINPQPDAGGNYCFASGIQSIADPNVNALLNNYIKQALSEDLIGPLNLIVK